ncbi:NAD(P)/FAD-dependent oxidoreductase, partial [Bradyrhizobium sp.]|uniref:NAD(P)/FAD-dependent oxidoreductase n=1 Tax=Bradyrhizobium sp. TaxID=376 RepID=UPI0025BF60DA
VKHVLGEVEAIDVARLQVTVKTGKAQEMFAYDRLVLTLGSELVRPPIPGLAAHSFDVDTYASALRLDAHLAALARQPTSDARSTVVIVGAGFTGIEVATEMPAKLDRAGVTGHRRIVLVDPSAVVGATIGQNARPVINEALSALNIETRLAVIVTSVDASSITLSSGEVIATDTVVWCAGMRASPLAAGLCSERDRSGRLMVDPFMRASGLKNVFAAGDVASCIVDGVHATVMSCQFARPMGRFAGHNVVADLFGEPMLPLNIDWYVTVLDLGKWGALYTVGWDRLVRTTGASAKSTKLTINHERIYPPRSGSRADLLAAAAPTLQAPPAARP